MIKVLVVLLLLGILGSLFSGLFYIYRDRGTGVRKARVVLPSASRPLPANGARGIADGWATPVPPHNLAELCDAAL